MPRPSRAQRGPKVGAHRVRKERRARSDDIVGTIRPLTARSILATALLGANEPRLQVNELVAAAALFGINASAARTCLSRMVSSGELMSDNRCYALTGRLLERRRRIDEAARHDDAAAAARRWERTWELAIVSLERRSAADRHELRRAAAALHLAEIREGVWIRPDNLDPERSPSFRAVLAEQCAHFRGAESDLSVETVRSLFGLDAWMRDATRLNLALNDELDSVRQEPSEGGDTLATLAYQFALSIAVVRHLQRDPLLPAVFLPEAWPAATLRNSYRKFDSAFKRRMNQAFRQRVR